MGWHIAGGIVLIGIGCLIWACIEPHWVAHRKEKLQGPAGLAGRRMVFISDIHCSRNFSPARLGKLVDRINALQPDIVLLGGDYTDRAGSKQLAIALDVLQKLHAKHKFAVPGNHDGPSSDAMAQAFQRAGIRLLRNETACISIANTALWIAGVEDILWGAPGIHADIRKAAPDEPVVLLCHSPDYLDQLYWGREKHHAPHDDQGRIDWIFCGHTHGGQLTLFGLFAPFISSFTGNRYRGGWYRIGKSRVLVSHGVGTTVVPLRFFARPQLHELVWKQGG